MKKPNKKDKMDEILGKNKDSKKPVKAIKDSKAMKKKAKC